MVLSFKDVALGNGIFKQRKNENENEKKNMRNTTSKPTSEGKDKRWPGRREGREREKKGISVDNNDKNKQTKKYHFNRR